MSHIPNGWYMVLNRLPEGEFPGTSTPDSHPDTSMDISYELRLDLWEGDFPQKRPPLTAPVIVTDRGHFGNEARTLKRDALCRKLGGWIDVDPTTDAPAPDDIPWIMSRHLETPDLSLATMLRDEAKNAGARGLKIVFPSETSLSTRTRLLQLCRDTDFPCVAFCLSGHGDADRLSALEEGQPWGYLTADEDKTGNDKIPGISEVIHRYQWPRISHVEKRFVVIGHQVSQSLSPDWHNSVLADYQIPARFHHWSTEHPDEILTNETPLNFDAIAITAPHKKWARTQGLGVDSFAEGMPAWNTLLKSAENRWQGTSTDGIAALDLLEDREVSITRIVIMGGGGAALSLAHAIQNAGGEAQLLSRSAQENSTQYPELHWSSDDDTLRSATTLINATGTDPESTVDWPWDLNLFQGEVFMDLDYSRDPSVITSQFAHHRSLTVIDGLDFFAAQARRQAKWMYGVDIPAKEARDRLDVILKRRTEGHFPRN